MRGCHLKVIMENFIIKNRTFRTFVCIASIFAVLAIGIFLRTNSFYLRHNTGDQRAYVGVAAKLDHLGFSEYNLRRINIAPDEDFLIYSIADKNDEGDLMRQLKKEGTSFYDLPLFHAPPLFAYAIMLSHRLFADGKPYRVVYYNESKEEITKTRPKNKLYGQFYCTIIPIFFNCLTILFCFLLGKFLFSARIGILSALLMAVSPASILASQRIWADEVLTFFILATMLFWYLAVYRNSLFFSILTGCSYGLSFLTKDSSLLLFLPLIACLYISPEDNVRTKIPKIDLKLVLFIIITVLITLPWYLTVIKHYGTPFYNPHEAGISSRVQWFAFIKQRPWYTYLFGIPFQVPIYVIGYIGILIAMFKLTKDRKGLFLAVWFLSYLIILTITTKMNEMLGPDHRYMLPAYPALAILSSKYIDTIRIKINNKTHILFGNLLVLIVLIVSCYWSVKVGTYYSITRDEIMFPF